MRSSYIENNYGSIFRALILASKPKLVLEFGVLDGFSLFYISKALKFNHKMGYESKFYAYDLWDDYEYNHGSFEEVNKMIETQRLEKYVTLKKGDVFEVYKDFEDESVDFMHIDISNNGDILIKVLELWKNKMSNEGMIAFEGGSLERDNISWMKKYNFPSIRNELMNNPLIYKNWDIQIFTEFPSLTLLWKKYGKNIRL